MRVALLTASSINGIITGERGRDAHELAGFLETPPEVWTHKGDLRRRYGAVLVGTETVRIVNPTMTSHARPGERCVRATLDRTGRLPRGHRFFDGSARTLVGVCEETPRDYLEFLQERGVEAVPAGRDRIDLARFLAGLEERGIDSVVCEGGGVLNRALLTAGLVERIHLLLLPAVLDAGAVHLFEGAGAPVRLRLEGVERAGEFVWVEYEVAPTPGPSPA
jgi:diaminohydroxyphosphoribosylaminopyrimidine deaminase/5-amino-6-(5-phosphoribosylamino)uracil reductase